MLTDDAVKKCWKDHTSLKNICILMRAGNASGRTNKECTTPNQEANAQLYQGGIDGAYTQSY